MNYSIVIDMWLIVNTTLNASGWMLWWRFNTF